MTGSNKSILGNLPNKVVKKMVKKDTKDDKDKKNSKYYDKKE